MFRGIMFTTRIVVIVLVFVAGWHCEAVGAEPTMQPSPGDASPKTEKVLQMPGSEEGRRGTTVTAEDYIGVIRDALKTFNELPKEHTAQLEKALVEDVRRGFRNAGAGNESEAKFARFRERFGGLLTLWGTGVPAEPAIWADEKLNYLKKNLWLRLAHYFYAVPFPREQEDNLRRLLARVGKAYAQELRNRFPEYESVAGDGGLMTVVGRGMAPVEQCLGNPFSSREWRLSAKSLEQQAGHKLPEVKKGRKDVGQVWLEKFEKETDPASQIAFKQQYRMVVEREMKVLLRGWTRSLYYNRSTARSRVMSSIVGADLAAMKKATEERNAALTVLSELRKKAQRAASQAKP